MQRPGYLSIWRREFKNKCKGRCKENTLPLLELLALVSAFSEREK
jgi:hypothetical protein